MRSDSHYLVDEEGIVVGIDPYPEILLAAEGVVYVTEG